MSDFGLKILKFLSRNMRPNSKITVGSACVIHKTPQKGSFIAILRKKGRRGQWYGKFHHLYSDIFYCYSAEHFLTTLNEICPTCFCFEKKIAGIAGSCQLSSTSVIKFDSEKSSSINFHLNGPSNFISLWMTSLFTLVPYYCFGTFQKNKLTVYSSLKFPKMSIFST